ncbi:Dps family protein [Paenibacillus kribbensis]|uniref:DNA starvation/stationary phase protection protein n=1 Tax=Paenibacillus kribbensis TaxID=172713 RepID=A0A222WGG4_9BACL|nr:DNA starvation/stationary phase protection protein [Paenibacillus kribbensis]ASR45449.1 DNA starvation/stationary phase protection protein [Paenibacillus kribbensis]
MSTLNHTNAQPTQEAIQDLHKALNRQVATWSVLYTKLHYFHWYVKGPNFFTLHAKFEELYNEATANLDTIAERLLAIGGRPAATLKEHLQLSAIQESTGEQTAEDMVKSVVADFKTITGELANGMEAADVAHDKATEDLLNGLREAVDKHIWMLSAYLG